MAAVTRERLETAFSRMLSRGKTTGLGSMTHPLPPLRATGRSPRAAGAGADSWAAR